MNFASVTRQSGISVGLSGLGLIALGVWGRREVSRALARERITSTADAKPPQAPVRSAGAARSLAEVIRTRTVAAAGGRVYAEVDEFVDSDGRGTSDVALAVKDERTGQPVENPEHALWIQSTTLQTALMQAYLSGRIADLTVGLGFVLVVAGAGICAAGSSGR